MFESLLDDEVTALDAQGVLLSIGGAVALGLVIALIYMKTTERYTKGFAITLALLPALVATVIMMTSGNLGSAVAVMGAFSLIRFRSTPGTAREIVSIFFSMAVGLACGMGQLMFAAVITAIIAIVLVILTKTKFGEMSGREKNLRIRMPEDLDYTEVFDDIFEKYTTRVTLNQVKTVNLGSMYDLDYDIVMKDPADEKRMIDDLRVRNGNLRIIMGRKPEDNRAL